MRRLRIEIRFCDQHVPRQRGSKENNIGLLRQFFPRVTDLSTIIQTELNELASPMNQKPKKALGWKTHEEAMPEVLATSRRKRCTTNMNPP